MPWVVGMQAGRPYDDGVCKGSVAAMQGPRDPLWGRASSNLRHSSIQPCGRCPRLVPLACMVALNGRGLCRSAPGAAVASNGLVCGCGMRAPHALGARSAQLCKEKAPTSSARLAAPTPAAARCTESQGARARACLVRAGARPARLAAALPALLCSRPQPTTTWQATARFKASAMKPGSCQESWAWAPNVNGGMMACAYVLSQHQGPYTCGGSAVGRRLVRVRSTTCSAQCRCGSTGHHQVVALRLQLPVHNRSCCAHACMCGRHARKGSVHVDAPLQSQCR